MRCDTRDELSNDRFHPGFVHNIASYLVKVAEVDGTVEHGDKRGRMLGFPTANLSLDEGIEVRRGVYVSTTQIKIGDQLVAFRSVSSLGFRPTFSGTSLRLETHIFDFSSDIYDQLITVSLYDYLRSEVKFKSLDDLSIAITNDKANALACFAKIDASSIGKIGGKYGK